MLRLTDELVVTAAGPLMVFGRVDQLSLLPALFRQVRVPQQVLDECLEHPELPDAQRIAAAVASGWVRVVEAQLVDIRGLDAGECCAIGCALDSGAVLLVDDRAARRHAEALGLTVLGTLGVLVLAKRHGLIPAVRGLVEAMRDGGHHISEAAFEAVLAVAGEPLL